MDLLTAILACSVYTSDDSLVRAIAQSNSHGNAFAVLDAAASAESDDPRPAEPKTHEAAMARFEEVRSKDGKPLLGWMQLPPSWVTMFGRDLREAFDPCVNISIGTAMLSTFDYECSVAMSPSHRMPRKEQARSPRRTEAAVDRRACVAGKYAEALSMPDLVTIITLELRYQRPTMEWSAANAQLVTTGRIGPWGANRVFFPAVGTEDASEDNLDARSATRVSSTEAGRIP